MASLPLDMLYIGAIEVFLSDCMYTHHYLQQFARNFQRKVIHVFRTIS